MSGARGLGGPLRVWGSVHSYFTGKLEGYLRFKEIPYEFVPASGRHFSRVLREKTGATQVPAVELPDGRFMTDTTPIIAWLEGQVGGTPVIPRDPLQAFVSRLVEDYADEWLWRSAMHYRWSYVESRVTVGTGLARELGVDLRLPLSIKRRIVATRQLGIFVNGDGVSRATRAHVEAGYHRLLERMSAILAERPFLLGARPTLADVGLFGPLFRHFAIDPTPAAIMRRDASDVYEWVARLWNARASELDGPVDDGVPDSWGPLLDEIGETHLEQLAANAAAYTAGQRRFSLECQGTVYASLPTSRYRVWCLEELRGHYEALPEASRAEARTLLERHGCWEPLFRVDAKPSGHDVDRRAPFGRGLRVMGEPSPRSIAPGLRGGVARRRFARGWRTGALAVLAALALLVPAAAPQADDATVVLRGARLHPVSGPVIEQGTIVVRDGKIVGIGPDAEIAVPDGARVHDLAGRTVIPGLVDSHSHVGVYARPASLANADGNELTNPVQSQLRAVDAIFPDDPGIRMAVAGGITTANIMPGSGNVFGGQTAYVKLRGETVDEMLIDLPGDLVGGLKMANGENTKRAYGTKGKSPATRMAIAALQREVFEQAIEYRRKQRAYAERPEVDDEEPPAEPPARDLALEPIVEVLDGRRTVHHHSHRADDIASVLRLQREYGFDLVIQHGSEAWRLADELARRDVPVSLIMLDSPGGKLEASRLRIDTAALLERAGARVAIHTDDMVTPSRLFLRSGALAVRGGMSESGALRALTLEPARMMGLDARIGSLEVGKDADLVVLSGEPFSVYTHVLETWIDGQRVFDRSDPVQRRHATGGFAHAERHPAVPTPEPGVWP